MYLWKLVFGKIGLPKDNVISVVYIYVLTPTINFQESIGTCVFDLKILVSQGKVVKVQMGGCHWSDIHGDGGSHNSIVVDLNLTYTGLYQRLEGNLEAFRRV